MTSPDIVHQAIEAARAGRKTDAREMLLQVVESDPYNELAWIWLSGLVDSLEDRIVACENALTINPSNEKVKAYLAQLYQLRTAEQEEIPPVQVSRPQAAPTANPPVQKDLLAEAVRLEQDGRFNEALDLYKLQATTVKDSRKFDEIYKQIIRIEALQKENIRYVSPMLSILRLTFTWPLMYFLFVLLHAGFNPFAHLDVVLWLGLPVVVAGSFLLAVSEVRSRHVIWKTLFDEDGDGSRFARSMAAVTGWLLIIFPHIFLFLNALGRLRNFIIPPEPF